MNKSNWKDVEGYEGFYKVSEDGRVFSVRADRELTPDTDKEGYKLITFSVSGSVKKFRIHRLVAHAFINNPENYDIVNHIDGDKGNNVVSNLEWCNYSQNMLHAYNLGLAKARLGEDNIHSKLTNNSADEIKEDILSGMRYDTIAEKHDISPSTISMINTGKRWGDTPIKTERTTLKGSENPASKLTEKKVKEIFECLKRGEQQNDVAKKFSVVKGLISDIARRVVWTHVETDYVYAPKKNKLSEEDIAKISEYAKNKTYTRKEMGIMFGVSKALIDKVLTK